MENYLPIIKALLSEWYVFTLNNAAYAAALAVAVWLLTAILYSIKIAAINRKHNVGEKITAETLHTAQQQLQHTQEELASTIEQMEKAQLQTQDETQRALSLEQLIYQRNQQIAGIIQLLATSFDLGERPLLASEDVKAESLWQQHDKVVNLLIERLRTEQKAKAELQQAKQAETAKLAEKDALLEILQSTLTTHTNQLSKLEQTLEQQNTLLQQQGNTQQILSETLKNLQTAAPRPVEVQQEPIAPPIAVQPTQPAVAPVIQSAPIAPPVQEQRIEPVIEIPQPAITQPPEQPQTAVTWRIDESPIEITTFEESHMAPLFSDPEPQISDEPEETAPIVASDDEEEQSAQSAQPSKGSLGKIKTLFGKKQAPIKTEPQWTADEAGPADIESSAKNKSGKLKGFYSKLRSKDK